MIQRSLTLLLLLLLTGCVTKRDGSAILGEDPVGYLKRCFDGADVVALVKVDGREERTVFTCLEIWKAKQGQPQVGAVIDCPEREKQIPQKGEAIVFFSPYPTQGWFNCLWLDGGKLGVAPELSLSDVKRLLSIKKG